MTLTFSARKTSWDLPFQTSQLVNSAYTKRPSPAICSTISRTWAVKTVTTLFRFQFVVWTSNKTGVFLAAFVIIVTSVISILLREVEARLSENTRNRYKSALNSPNILCHPWPTIKQKWVETILTKPSTALSSQGHPFSPSIISSKEVNTQARAAWNQKKLLFLLLSHVEFSHERLCKKWDITIFAVCTNIERQV